MAPGTTVLMLPGTAFCRHQRRCATLQDPRLSLTVGTAPLMMTPTSSSRAPVEHSANVGSPVVRTMRRCHSAPSLAFASFKAGQVGSVEGAQQETISGSIGVGGTRHGPRRFTTCGADFMKETSTAHQIQHTHKLKHTALKDAGFADSAGTASPSTPLMMTPISSSSFGDAASLRSPVANSANVGSPVVRTAMRRCHSVPSLASGSSKSERPGFSQASQQETSASPSDAGGVRRRTRQSTNFGAEIRKDLCVSVVGPGGGTGINACVYSALAKKDGFRINILGQSRAAYDRYPASWAKEGGAPAPNLESFAMDLLDNRSIDNVDCLVVGSRGGQVVLPTFWQARGAEIPPVIVMNGGCAMNLPTAVQWPEAAVSFLLLGGQDYFRGQVSMADYLKNAQHRVPKANSTTAILLVNEMTHMPQSLLLTAILHLMIRAITSWKRSGDVPIADFHEILRNLRKGAWSGNLSFKCGPGDAWQHIAI